MSLLTRRRVLTVGLGAGGALVVGSWLRHEHRGAGTKDSFEPNAFIRVPAEGPVRIVVARTDMGQGTITGTAMLIAEELEVDPSTLAFDFAPADRAYDNPKSLFQLTGGSTSTAGSWEPLRVAGATARELLKEAAAKRWSVPRSELVASLGVVSHPPSKRSARYGELAAEAVDARVHEPALKQKKDFTVIGKPLGRLDATTKTNGSAVFGIDVKVPGALVAVVVRCPVPGGTVKSVADEQARAMPGVKAVTRISNGVAVVAQTYWQARKAAAELKVDWDEGPLATFDSSSLAATHRALVASPTAMRKRVRDDGKVDERLAAAGANVLEAEYVAPFLAHATMEPQNATAHVTDDSCEVWAPTQSPAIALDEAVRLTGLAPSAIRIHQTFLGGGFGRRISQDYVVEAIEVSKAVRAPVKVVWSREDDLRHSFYRPAATHVLRGVVDGSSLVAWRHQVVSQSILKAVASPFVEAVTAGAPAGLTRSLTSLASEHLPDRDPTSFEGTETLAYAVPNVAVEFLHHESGVPTGFWRSVGHSHTAFATESFVDECAHAAKVDPLEFRRGLLARHPKRLAVLEQVKQASRWGQTLAPGHGLGVAVHESFETTAAAVIEASLDDDSIRVHRVVMAVDCGTVVNPDIVRSQLESSIIFGLSAALSQQITFKGGRVQQSNFHEYAPLRLSESPVIETVLLPSDEPPTGIGEPGLPVVAPALANAVFAATGKRLRSLPFSLEG